MSVTDFRVAVQNELAKDLGLEVEAFPIEGPLEDRDAIAVWTEGVRENSGAVQEQSLLLHARAFRQWTPAPNQTAPPDITPLETLLESVQTSLKDIQVSAAVQATGVWMFRTTTLTIAYDQWAVEVEILATRQNPFLA